MKFGYTIDRTQKTVFEREIDVSQTTYHLAPRCAPRRRYRM